jgi:Na+/melibiose symporter-like transporter
MRVLFAFVPVGIYLMGIWMMSRYSLTPARMAEIRQTLEARRAGV